MLKISVWPKEEFIFNLDVTDEDSDIPMTPLTFSPLPMSLSPDVVQLADDNMIYQTWKDQADTLEYYVSTQSLTEEFLEDTGLTDTDIRMTEDF